MIHTGTRRRYPDQGSKEGPQTGEVSAGATAETSVRVEELEGRRPVNPILAGQTPIFEGLAADLPPVEPTGDDLAAIAAGSWADVQDRLVDVDLRLVRPRVDELVVRRARRAAGRLLSAATRNGVVA
jgi:hypothetical protein